MKRSQIELFFHPSENKWGVYRKHSSKINLCMHVHSDLDKATFLNWGDYWVKRQLLESLYKLYSDKINFQCSSKDADVIIYGFGSPYLPKPSNPHFYNDQSLNIAWFYSHPEKMDMFEAKKYDHIFTASSRQIKTMDRWGISNRLEQEPLYACTNFKLDKRLKAPECDILFVGNARGGSLNGRKSVRWLSELETDELDVRLYGAKWKRKEYAYTHNWLCSGYHDYYKLPDLYRSAVVNLIDGHDQMRNSGFVPAKVFDTIAAGGWVVMEYNSGIQEIFGDRVSMFTDIEEMKEQVVWSLNNHSKIEPQIVENSLIAQKYTYDNVATKLFKHIESVI